MQSISIMKSIEQSNSSQQVKEQLPLKEKVAEMSFEDAVNLFVEEAKLSGATKQKEHPELVAVYGQPHAGKTFFIRKVMEELSKDEKHKFLVGYIQTSDDPEANLKQFNDMRENFPNYKSPLIFFHEISLGGVDYFTLEKFNKFADKNLYIFNPEREKIDREMIKKNLEHAREAWSQVFKKPKPKTEVAFVVNPQSKIKKL